MHPSDVNLIRQTIEFLQDIIKNENVNKLKLAESFISGIYTNEKYNDIKTSLDFKICDDEFFFSVSIKKDKEGNIIMVNIEKDDI